MLLVKIHARAARFDLTANGRWNTELRAPMFGEILGYRTDRARLSDERVDNAVDRLENAAVDLDLPGAVRHDIVAGARLSFRARGQEILIALRCDVVDCHLDFVLLPPFVSQ